MPGSQLGAPERLVKSVERVRDLGEVFTPAATVEAMLDLMPAEIWSSNPSPTFLEPACGDGNFLVAILNRKLQRVAADLSAGRLGAGDTAEAAQFHAIEVLASIYAVDISIDNIVGGTPGHELGARSRLLALFSEWNASFLDRRLSSRSLVRRAAEWVVEHNLIVGNMLPFDASGKASGRDAIPLIEYRFEPVNHVVTLMKTTMGEVLASAEDKAASAPSLFGVPEPERLWKGKAINLAEADRVEAPKLGGPARNGSRGRR